MSARSDANTDMTPTRDLDPKSRDELLTELDALRHGEKIAKTEVDYRAAIVRQRPLNREAAQRLADAQEARRLCAHALAVWIDMYGGHLARMSLDVGMGCREP